MGLQKYRADQAGEKRANGAQPFYTNWIGGTILALIRNCPIQHEGVSPRTVYIRAEPDTFFSQPAACQYKGKTIKGFLSEDSDGMRFIPYKGQL